MRIDSLGVLLGLSAVRAAVAAASSVAPPTTVGVGPSTLCGGPSTGGVWKAYDDKAAASKEGQADAHRDSIFMDIDTSRCAFERMPVYVVSVAAAKQPSAGPATPDTLSLTASTLKSVRVTMWDPTLNGGALLAVAAKHGWSVNWAGETGSNGGRTPAGKTPWRLLAGASSAGKTVFYCDVDTTASARADGAATAGGGFPHYFPALLADWTAESELGLWHAQGARSVHAPTATGFRVYVRLTSRPPHRNPPADLVHWQRLLRHWSVGYIAMPDRAAPARAARVMPSWEPVLFSSGKVLNNALATGGGAAPDAAPIYSAAVRTPADAPADVVGSVFLSSISTPERSYATVGEPVQTHPATRGFDLLLSSDDFARDGALARRLWSVNYATVARGRRAAEALGERGAAGGAGGADAQFAGKSPAGHEQGRTRIAKRRANGRLTCSKVKLEDQRLDGPMHHRMATYVLQEDMVFNNRPVYLNVTKVRTSAFSFFYLLPTNSLLASPPPHFSTCCLGVGESVPLLRRDAGRAGVLGGRAQGGLVRREPLRCVLRDVGG